MFTTNPNRNALNMCQMVDENPWLSRRVPQLKMENKIAVYISVWHILVFINYVLYHTDHLQKRQPYNNIMIIMTYLNIIM